MQARGIRRSGQCGMAVEMPALPVRRLASAIEWWTDVNPYRGRRADDCVRRRRPRRRRQASPLGAELGTTA